MATLTGKKIKNTYDALIKIEDNNTISSTPKQLTDGLGNSTALYLSSTKLGIGTSPTEQFHITGAAKIGGNLTVVGNLTVNGTTTHVDSTIIEVGDNMIELAKDNTANTKDIGWYGTINSGGEKYVGIKYDAGSGVVTPTFELGLTLNEPGNTADWSVKGKLVIGALDATGGTFSGQVTIPLTPINNAHAASKKYVDDSVDGLIDGSGTANDVVMWQDSDTLTDAPIAISGNNSTFAGDVDIEGGLLAVGQGNNGENRIEIGKDRTTNGYAYIDLVGDATYTDYGFRIIRDNTGANAATTIVHRGTGDFVIKTNEAANLKFSTSNTNALTLDSLQNATFSGTISSGDITIEDTNPNLTLSDTSTTNLIHEIKSSSNNLRLSADTNDVDASTKIEFWTDGVERLEIGSSNVTLKTDILPNTDSTYDLGSTSLRWANVWADNINGGSVVNGSGAAERIAIWSDSDTLSYNDNLKWDGEKLIVESGNSSTSSNTISITHTRNDSNVSTQAVKIDANFSGADTTTADRSNAGLYIDLDSGADGDAANEVRSYGVWVDARITGYNDLLRGGYFRVESNNTTEKTAEIVGVYGDATHDSSSTNGGVSNMYGVRGVAAIQDYGDVDNAYGVHGLVQIANNRNANVDVVHGLYGEIQIDEATALSYGDMYGVRSVIDNNEGSVPTFSGQQYLFRGDYQGTKKTGAYGIYCEGDKHYFTNKLGIDYTDPQQSIHVVNTDGANIILNSNTGAENNGIFMTEGAASSPYTNGAYVHYDSTNNAFKIQTGSSTLTTRLTIARDTGAATFSGDVDVNGGELKISGNYAKLYFVDTAGSDEDAYIVNNANGLFFGKTNSPSGSNDILSLDLSNKNATFAGDVTILEDLYATNNNLKLHAGGTHVLNIDVNRHVYPNTHNSTDLGYSTSLAFKDLYLSGNAYFGSDGHAQKVYKDTVTINNSTYTTIATVNGDTLASGVRLNVTGTSGSVVIDVDAKIMVQHYRDILIQATSGYYRQIYIKVVSNNNEDFAIELKRDTGGSETTTSVNVEIIPLSSEEITFTNSHSYNSLSHEHFTEYGESWSSNDPGASGRFNLSIKDDGAKIKLGAGKDLQIYSENNDGYINSVTDDLFIRATDNIYIQPQGGENGITLTGNAGVFLYYNNSQKLETTSDGVNVGNSANISMSSGSAGQLRVLGNGYTGAIALDGDAMHIYHNSSSRDLILGTNETARLTINGSSGNATFSSDVFIPVAKRLYFGGGSHTYISEDVNDRLRFFCGGLEFMRFTEDTADTITFYREAFFEKELNVRSSSGDLEISGDTSGNVYMNSKAGEIRWRANGSSVNSMTLSSSLLSINEHVKISDNLNFSLFNSNGSGSSGKLNMPRGGAITFYGDTSLNHSIMSKNASGTTADDIRINSYGAVTINLDSNNNNSANANFKIGKHGNHSGGITDLFEINGENGDCTIEGDLTVNGDVSFGSNTFDSIVTTSAYGDQNTQEDASNIPSTTGAEFLRIQHPSYTDGRYTTEIAKVDRGGGLPIYIRESFGSANSFSNIARFGSHTQNSEKFEVFGNAKFDGIEVEKNGGNGDIICSRVAGVGMKIQAQASVGVLATTTNHRLDLRTNSNTRMTIDNNGRVGINDTSPSAQLDVLNAASGRYSGAFDYNSTNGNVGCMKFRLSGGSTSPSFVDFIYGTSLVGFISTSGSSTFYSTSSDYRLKENVVELTGALDRLDNLQPKRFNFIEVPDETVDGFIAHEITDIVPEAVIGEKDAVDENGNIIPQGIDQSKLVPLLVAAVKELKAEVESLKNQLM